jgi:Rrf2 family protein
MDIIRRNTDYGLRAALVLAEHYDRAVPVRRISSLEQIPYPLTCKIMQKLHRAGIAKSAMGPRGGFKLAKDPTKISLLQLTGILQGNLMLSRCLAHPNCCPRRSVCSINRELAVLQKQISDFFVRVSLDDLLENQPLHKLIYEMRQIFKGNTRRIEHAFKVLDYAEQIYLTEGGNPFTIKAAAVLHDIGIPASIRKYGSSAGNYQEIEGPPIAQKILRKYKIPSDQINHICKIIANHHTARNIDTTEFKIIYDADWLVNLPEDFPNADQKKLKSIIKRVFKTKAGYSLARKLFLNQ